MASVVYRAPLISGSLGTYSLPFTPSINPPVKTLDLLSTKKGRTLSLLFASLPIDRKLGLCTSK